MALTNLTTAEDALALPPAERADPAKLLIESLAGDPRTDVEIKAGLQCRLDELVSGRDAGLTYEELFGQTLCFLGLVHERRHPDFLKR